MNKKLKIFLVAAARPNFMKIGPIFHEMKNYSEKFEPIIVHTGQHYDKKMSDVFFKELNLPAPHISLGVGSGSHAEQTGKVMIEFEKVCLEQNPDRVIVVGDVNSTLACSITAVKLNIPVAHVEAGLRSRDRTMPEEINRMVTDSISDIFFTPSVDADENLIREGHSPDKIIFVGNVMIDSLVKMMPQIEKDESLKNYSLNKKSYILLTLHRPVNVDNHQILIKILDQIIRCSGNRKIIFPVHPRTLKALNKLNLTENKTYRNVLFLDPLNYISFISLMKDSVCVITDSGGVQEETTYLGIPCLTYRTTTERPVTVKVGTNKLVDINEIQENLNLILTGKWKKGTVPDMWDGRAAERIVEFFVK